MTREEAKQIQQEIENWEYMADGLIYEHQQSVKRDILKHVDVLKTIIKETN